MKKFICYVFGHKYRLESWNIKSIKHGSEFYSTQYECKRCGDYLRKIQTGKVLQPQRTLKFEMYRFWQWYWFALFVMSTIFLYIQKWLFGRAMELVYSCLELLQ